MCIHEYIANNCKSKLDPVLIGSDFVLMPKGFIPSDNQQLFLQQLYADPA